MPKYIETHDTEEGFWYIAKIDSYNEKNAKARISVPTKKVKEMNLLGKKLKVTIDIIDETDENQRYVLLCPLEK